MSFKCEARKFVLWGMHPGILVIGYYQGLDGDLGVIIS